MAYWRNIKMDKVINIEEALKRIEELEKENAELREELEYYRNRKLSGRQKHNAKWMAIYNDFCNPFLEVHHNIFENMPRGLLNGGGAENNWKDNLFIDVAVPMRVQYNNLLFETLYTKKDNSWVYDTTQSNLFTTYGSNEFVYFDVANGAWATKYPKVAEVKQQIIDRGPDAILPSSTITGNVCVFIGEGDVYREYNKTAADYYNETGDSNVVTGDYMDPNIMMQNGQKTLKEGRTDYCTINNTYSMDANAIQNAMTNLGISKDMAGIQ